MRIPWEIASKAKRLFVSSPAKASSVDGGNPLSEFDYNGIKEEIFFDSKAWLDSDCEDDFYSINGDSTPSRGSTPNFQTSTPATPTPRLNKVHFVDTFPDTKSESSPTARKMKLSDILSDKLQGEVADEAISGEIEINEKTNALKTDTNRLRKFWNGSPRVYKANSYIRDVKSDKSSNSVKRTRKAKHCCMPGFSHTLGFSDKKKQKMSPDR